MVFTPSKAEPDIWMHQNGDIHEYIGIYVDDLVNVAKGVPQHIMDELENKYKFKLKGTGLTAFYLGM